jgi:large repetitive protein
VFRPNTSLTGYEAQVTFEVEDRPGDRTSQKALLTISFRVEAPANTAPTIQSAGSINVPQLNEPVGPYDMKALVTDEQGDALTFNLTERPAGFDVQLVDSQITVTSTNTASPPAVGAKASIRFTVTDGIGDHKAVEGVVVVTVIATNKAAPTATDIGPIDAIKNVAAPPQDVISKAFNPFPEIPLKLVSVTVSGAGAVGCAANCGQSPIVYTPNQPGTFTVQYVVADGLTPPRTARGTITYVVKGKPLAPGIPDKISVGDGVVNLTWTVKSDDLQGGTLKNYVVTVVETGKSLTSDSTSLKFTGLENAKDYHFTVHAVNEIGVGDESGQSNAARPDKVPDPPKNLRFTNYGDGTLTLQWDPSVGNYSAVIDYEVELDGFGTIKLGTPALTVTQSGLKNGTDYKFRVKARNSSEQGWGDFSPPSPAERPSRYPDAPGGIAAAAAGDGGTPRVKVTWGVPASDGGRAIVSYNVCRVQDGLCQPGDNSRQVTFATTPGAINSFTVVATNTDRNRANSDPSGPSNAVQGLVTPGAPTINGVSTRPNGLTASSTIGSNGGCSSSFVEYSRDNGSSWQANPAFDSLDNGVTYTIVARTTLGVGCTDLAAGVDRSSARSAGLSEIPYGPLGTPTISASVSGTSITYSWNANQGANGRPWTAVVSGEGCSWSTGPGGAQTGSCPTNPGYNSGGRTVTITVSAPGVPPTSNQNPPVSTGPPPAFTVSISRGAAGPAGQYINGSISNGDVGAQYWISCRTGTFGEFVNTNTGYTSLGTISFANRFIGGDGTASWGSGICYNAASTSVYVWTSTGQSFTTGAV